MPTSTTRSRAFRILAATGLCAGLSLVCPAGSPANAADTTSTPPPKIDTNPPIFSVKFSAQAVAPTTAATLQVDDSYAWVHGFFNKGQVESAIGAAEYSEIYDPGFLAGAVIFSSTNPTPTADPNSFPGYAWASYPVPADQTSIRKCVDPTSMQSVPCNDSAPDQALSTIDPSKPSGFAHVTYSGAEGGSPGGQFTSTSTQEIIDGAVVVHAESAGQNVSFAGGLLKLANFRSVADTVAKADGTVKGTASCLAGDFTIMGQTLKAGPGGQLDSNQLQPLLDQLNVATGQKYTIMAPTPGSVVKGDHSVEASCQGPTVSIANPLPGPLAGLNVSQDFKLGIVDVTDGAALGDGFSPLLSPTAPGDTLAGLDSIGPTGPAPSLASPGLPSTSAAAPAAASPSKGTPSVASPRFRKIVHRPNAWLLFLLASLTGISIAGSAIGLRLAAGELSRSWRDRVAPIG
jgi:hypothetical protein